MASEEQRLIDDLFARLKSAEDKTGERDAEAEARIREHVEHQPAAPYYMAQTILMQEATLKRLQARVEKLENEQQEQRSSGGFLAGLFGGNERDSKREQPTTNHQPGWGSRAEPAREHNMPAGGRGFSRGMGGGRGSGFLGGALQTAAGVAGGVMLGNMMMDMFGDHQPEDMAGVIDDPTGGAEDTAATGGVDDSGFAPAEDEFASGPDDTTGFQDADFNDDMSDFGDDDFDEL